MFGRGGHNDLQVMIASCQYTDSSSASQLSTVLVLVCRVSPMPHMQPMAGSPSRMQRAHPHTAYHDPSTINSDLGAKLWDVRTSQKGSPRQAFSGGSPAGLSEHVSTTCRIAADAGSVSSVSQIVAKIRAPCSQETSQCIH